MGDQYSPTTPHSLPHTAAGQRKEFMDARPQDTADPGFEMKSTVPTGVKAGVLSSPPLTY